MPTTNIIHNTLLEAARKAENTVREAEDYRKTIEKYITGGLSSLPGSDGMGYVSSALSLAREKLGGLNQKKDSFNALCAGMKRLQEDASEADNKVKRKINSLAKPYVAQQNFFEKAGSWIYERFCSVEQLIKDGSLIGEMFINCLDQTAGLISRAAESVSDWFRYGGGRYLAKRIASVAAFLGTVVITCTTVVALTFCPPLAIVALAAGTVAMIYTFGNMVTVNSEMDKAERLEKEGKPGLARFYGETEGVKDWIEKKDFGGKTVNQVLGMTGTAYDVTGKTAQAVLQVLGIVSVFTGYTNVYGMDGKTVVGHDWSAKNMWTNMQRSFYQKFLDAGFTLKADASGRTAVTGIKGFKFLFGTPDLGLSDKTGYKFALNMVKTGIGVSEDVVSIFDGSADVIGQAEDFYELPLPDKITAYPELLRSIYESMFMPNGVTEIGEAFGGKIFDSMEKINDIDVEIREEIKEEIEEIREDIVASFT